MQDRPPRPLLIIEDGDEDYDMLRQALARFAPNQPVDRCLNGDEALAYLRQHQGAHPPNPGKPCLMIVDLNLPDLDGRELLLLLRKEPAWRGIPSIVLSTSSNPKDIAQAYDSGANCYLSKPLGLEKSEHMVQQICTFWLQLAALPD